MNYESEYQHLLLTAKETINKIGWRKTLISSALRPLQNAIKIGEMLATQPDNSGKELACPECGHIVGCLAPLCNFKSKVTA